MGDKSYWPGVVENRSKDPVWLLWDKGNAKWFGRPLAAGRRSPKGLDVDGVCAYYEGMKIAKLNWRGRVELATDQWWWLVSGAEVTIKDGYGMQTIKQTSAIGSLKVVQNTEVSDWGPEWEMDVDVDWGVKL